MSNKEACTKALKTLNYDEGVTIGSYIGELETKVKRYEKAMISYKKALLKIWELEETDASKGYAESVKIAGKTLWLFIGKE